MKDNLLELMQRDLNQNGIENDWVWIIQAWSKANGLVSGNFRADGSDEGNTYLLAEGKAADEHSREIYRENDQRAYE